MDTIEQVRACLGRGLVIPACPLALNRKRRLDERRQRALFRYYLAAGAGGLAVGVHTTQFAIRDPHVGLFRPVLELAAEELGRRPPQEPRLRKSEARNPKPEIVPSLTPRVSPGLGIAGICGSTSQAVAEASLALELGYHAGLLSLGALRNASENDLLAHCRTVADILPLFGFYLQPAVGGRFLPYSFWRRFAEIEKVVAIKIAPFNRYQTLDVVRAIAAAGRDDVALYTGNDDSILMDLLTPFRFLLDGHTVERHMVGGLLGHWAVWTQKAVELLRECRHTVQDGKPIPLELLCRANEVTDANAALFDAAHGYAGCIPGIHEVLRRQGLLEGLWCLDPDETLSPGQGEEIGRVCRAYPQLQDDDFVARNRDEWLRA